MTRAIDREEKKNRPVGGAGLSAELKEAVGELVGVGQNRARLKPVQQGEPEV